ncbi:MAG: paraslipin [Bdellovibrionales bacterium]|nr:paraslipin [Bdellovibrionales bacterium]
MEPTTLFSFIVWGLIFLYIIAGFAGSIRIVPNKQVLIVERLGQYRATLGAGLHILLPFLDKVTAKLNLKEETIDVPPQDCFSKDEVKVEVDGVIYMTVADPVKAAYGVTNYRYAATQLAQTTIRAVVGTIDLDKTFEERDAISAKVVETLSKAGAKWGIIVHRYEIRNIDPPISVAEAMERQVNAEREKRAMVAKAAGDKESRINRSEGQKAELINVSEGKMQEIINYADGEAAEILSIAEATADSIEKVGEAIAQPGGDKAIKLDVAQQYFKSIQSLGKPSSNVIVPADLFNMESMLDGMELDLS